MKTINIIMPLILTGLAGCGGSGGGSITTTSTAIDYGNGVVLTPNGNGVATAAVQTFDDGSGAIRGELNLLAAASGSNAIKFVGVTDDVEQYVNNISEEDIRAFLDLGLPLQDADYLGVAEYYEGDISIAGVTYTISVFKSKGDDSGIVAFGAKVPEDGSGNLEEIVALAIGDEASNLPTGQQTYSGVHLIGARQFVREHNGTGDVLTTGWGKFTMDVDFNTGTGNYRGETGSTVGGGNDTILSGSLAVDTNNGGFSGSNMSLTGSINGNSLDGQTATLEGNFHGDQGTSVSGIFYTNNVDYGGGFRGSIND